MYSRNALRSGVRKIAFGIGTFALLAICFWILFRPKVEIEVQGSNQIVQPHSLVDASIIFHNRGFLPLRIIDFASDCSCTVPGVESLKIAGRSESVFPLKIQVPPGDESHVFSVFFRTNDPFRGVDTALIALTAEYGVKMVPPRLIMSAGFGASEGDETVILSVSPNRPDFDWVECEIPGDCLVASVAELGSRRAVIRVRATDPVLSGEFKFLMKIRYRLQSEGEQTNEMIVCGQLTDEITAFPPIISMARGETRTVMISGAPPEPPQVEVIGSLDGHISVDFAQYPDCEIVAVENLKMPGGGSVIFRWESPAKRLSIPVRVLTN